MDRTNPPPTPNPPNPPTKTRTVLQIASALAPKLATSFPSATSDFKASISAVAALSALPNAWVECSGLVAGGGLGIETDPQTNQTDGLTPL